MAVQRRGGAHLSSNQPRIDKALIAASLSSSCRLLHHHHQIAIAILLPVGERRNLLPLDGTSVTANRGVKIRRHHNIMEVKELPLQNLDISSNRSKTGRRVGKAKRVVIHQIICSNSDWRMMAVAATSLKAYKIVLQIIINNSNSRLLTLSQQITHPVL